MIQFCHFVILKPSFQSRPDGAVWLLAGEEHSWKSLEGSRSHATASVASRGRQTTHPKESRFRP